MPLTVLFDFDGTIMDSDTVIFGAWDEIFRLHGAELSIDVVARLAGTTDAVWNPEDDILEQTGRQVDGKELHRHFDTLVRARVGDLPPMPGVCDRLDEAARLGWRIGCASSSDRIWVGGNLRRLGLHERFETIRTREDVARTKPDPALFRRAMEDLGADPARTVVLEDSRNGVLAAKAAGCFAVAIPTTLTRRLDLSEADLILSSMEELSLAALSERLGA
jgi:HAD superfamily hydrolase (TIGR01509 family)